MTFEMEPDEIANVDILYDDIDVGKKYRKSPLDNIKIMNRRYLSEIRDNYINKNEFLRTLAYKLKGIF